MKKTTAASAREPFIFPFARDPGSVRREGRPRGWVEKDDAAGSKIENQLFISFTASKSKASGNAAVDLFGRRFRWIPPDYTARTETNGNNETLKATPVPPQPGTPPLGNPLVGPVNFAPFRDSVRLKIGLRIALTVCVLWFPLEASHIGNKIMKTKLSRIVVLLATLAVLPLVQGCYGDKVNIAAAWVPADLQGVVIVAGGGSTAASTGGGAGSPAIPGGAGGGNYIP